MRVAASGILVLCAAVAMYGTAAGCLRAITAERTPNETWRGCVELGAEAGADAPPADAWPPGTAP